MYPRFCVAMLELPTTSSRETARKGYSREITNPAVSIFWRPAAKIKL